MEARFGEDAADGDALDRMGAGAREAADAHRRALAAERELEVLRAEAAGMQQRLEAAEAALQASERGRAAAEAMARELEADRGRRSLERMVATMRKQLASREGKLRALQASLSALKDEVVRLEGEGAVAREGEDSAKAALRQERDAAAAGRAAGQGADEQSGA